jgi:hypothetical protein
MKKIKLLLSVVFVLSAAALYAQQYNSESDFRIDWYGNDIKITGYVGSKSEVRIPPKIQNNTVSRIDSSAFKNTNITSVIIPDSVTTIGSAAFQDCTRLTSITIPDSVTNINSHTFSGCTRLTSVTIGKGVKNIGLWAFENCTSLSSITIPDGVDLESLAFTGCTNLTSVTFQGYVYMKGGTPFSGNLMSEYDGLGTYTRFAGGEIWKANFTPSEVAERNSKGTKSTKITTTTNSDGSTTTRQHLSGDEARKLFGLPPRNSE